MTAPVVDLFAGADDLLSAQTPYYGLNGENISRRRWLEIFEDYELRSLAEDYVQSDRGLVRVSTVWLGIDHRFYNPHNPPLPPIIFETMTFSDSPEYAYDGLRYVDAVSALDGHRMITDQMAQSWWLNLGGRA